MHSAVFIIIYGIVTVTLILLSYFIFWWIKKKEMAKGLRLLSLIPLMIFGYSIYEMVYPSAEFYERNFEEITTMEFPQSGEIKYKTASFPDMFGDYSSAFLIEVDPLDLEAIKNQIEKIGLKVEHNNMQTKEIRSIEKKTKGNIYSAQYVLDPESTLHYSVGFLEDNKSIIFSKVSW